MRRKKHKNDTKANGHWERKVRATKYFGGPYGTKYKHSDYRIEAKLWLDKNMRKIVNKEINKEIENL